MAEKKKNKTDIYEGFEQGPIRPPSEARSLLIRLTRNCPWNKCTFCPVYKKRDFSLRKKEHIKKDIDMLHKYLEIILQEAKDIGRVEIEKLNKIFNSLDDKDRVAFNAALNWFYSGMESIFIQDANSLIIKPDDLVEILEYIKEKLPMAQRTTSYARSHTIVRIKSHDLKRIANAGLNRIHIGLESGSDKVLALIKKGCTKDDHIKAGLKVKEAGMELSEYVMPGLGGVELSREHALETADALNKINPDFIRLRTLAISRKTPLEEESLAGTFKKPSDLMMAQELKFFLESLDGITSYIKSDHILNLLERVEGKMPQDKEKIVGIVTEFLNLPPQKRVTYQVGRRMGLFGGVDDMADTSVLQRVEETCKLYGVTPDNVDATIDELMKRFI